MRDERTMRSIGAAIVRVYRVRTWYIGRWCGRRVTARRNGARPARYLAG